jgi:hypothetical protein
MPLKSGLLLLEVLKPLIGRRKIICRHHKADDEDPLLTTPLQTLQIYN